MLSKDVRQSLMRYLKVVMIETKEGIKFVQMNSVGSYGVTDKAQYATRFEHGVEDIVERACRDGKVIVLEVAEIVTRVLPREEY